MGILIMADSYYRSSRRVIERKIRGQRRRHVSRMATTHVYHSRNTPSLHRKHQPKRRSPLSSPKRSTPLLTNHTPIRTQYQSLTPNEHPPSPSPFVHRRRSRSRCTPSTPAHRTKPRPNHQADVDRPQHLVRVLSDPSPTRAQILCKSWTSVCVRSPDRPLRHRTSRAI
jgi:hypothetical protein